MDKDVKKMTLDEIDEALEEKYGKNWLENYGKGSNTVVVDDDDELFKEFIERISCGETGRD